MSTAIEDALIEAKIDEIKITRDHGFVVPAEDLGDHLAAPMSMTSTAADRAVIYDTETGEPRTVLVNMLAKTLKKKRDGKPAFSTNPTKEWKQGTVPCWFNENSPRYAEIRTIPGLENFSCPASKLASEFDAELHAKYRHDRRYLRVKDYLDRKERDEANARQERLASAMLAMAENGQALRAGDGVRPEGEFRKVLLCDVEGCTRFFDSAQGLTLHKSNGHKE